MNENESLNIGPRSTSRIITRRFNAQVRGSFQSFSASGPDAASWTPLNGKHGDVFGVSDYIHHADGVDSNTVLQNAILHKITLLEVKNDFPLPLGVTMSCIPAGESTKTGHQYAFTTMSNSHNPQPLVLFSASETNNESVEWRSKYPQFNAQNLDTRDVLNVQGETYVFVGKSHPVVEVLHQNAECLNKDILSQTLIDNTWYKVSKQVFSTCCNVLRKDVLSKVNQRNLNDFTMQIHRIGNKDWSSFNFQDEIISAVPPKILATEDNAKINTAVSSILKMPYQLSARFEIVFEVQK